MAANPNTMTFRTVFSAEYQMSHFKEPVYQILADTRLESDLTKGQTVARSYASDVQVNDMGGDGSYSTQAITDTQETLVINKEKEAQSTSRNLMSFRHTFLLSRSMVASLRTHSSIKLMVMFSLLLIRVQVRLLMTVHSQVHQVMVSQ